MWGLRFGLGMLIIVTIVQESGKFLRILGSYSIGNSLGCLFIIESGPGVLLWLRREISGFGVFLYAGDEMPGGGECRLAWNLFAREWT